MYSKNLSIAVFAGLLWGSLAGASLAQERARSSTLAVTASVSPERVRLVAPSSVYQMQLEVFDSSESKVYDSGASYGNVLDWRPDDPGAASLAEGNFVCLVTVRDISGQLAKRWGVLGREAGEARWLVPAEAGQAAGEFELLEAAGRDPRDLIAASRAGAGLATTLLAHDGRRGLLASGSGGLSFRSGDYLAGKDVERMRLTEPGNLGIGVKNPEAKLDVAGEIRTSEGIRFPDGTLQTTAALSDAEAEATEDLPPVAELVDGTGTVNTIAKWTTSTNIGDSAITEVNGQVGINAPTPSGSLHIGGTATQDLFAGMGPNLATGPAFNFGYAGTSLGRSAGFFNVRADAGATAPNPSLRFMTGSVERMIVTNAGNVGIGTLGGPFNPLAKLDIQGGADGNGANDPKAMALQWRGGGYRHWIRTRHSASINGNAIDFFVNNTRGPGDSLGPGVGSELAMTLDSGRVGIGTGTSAPSFKLQVIDPSNTGLRVQTNTPGGTVASFGGNGAFNIDGGGVQGGRFTVNETGTVVIGLANDVDPSLIVGGPIHSTVGGFKFPDNSVQTTAATTAAANDTYTTVSIVPVEITPGIVSGTALTSILGLNLPTGKYLLSATVQFKNTAAIFAQNNSRRFFCRFRGENMDYEFTMPAGGTFGYDLTTTLHAVLDVGSTFPTPEAELLCGGADPNENLVFAFERRLTAVKLTGNVFVQ